MGPDGQPIVGTIEALQFDVQGMRKHFHAHSCDRR
jgi:hypothetical protein